MLDSLIFSSGVNTQNTEMNLRIITVDADVMNLLFITVPGLDTLETLPYINTVHHVFS